MIKIGLTGGMGCGKSTVARIFSSLGIPVYDADREAKRLSALPRTQAAIAATFGVEAARNKAVLADIVFGDPAALARLNALVHPLVMEDCEQWLARLGNEPTPPPYTVVEAAILFESGMNKLFDRIITVEAPLNERIERVMRRDGYTREQVMERMAHQLSDEERRAKADFILDNSSDKAILQEVLNLHHTFHRCRLLSDTDFRTI